MVKSPPVTQETWVRPLGLEDLLEKGMVTHSSTLARGIPWTVWPMDSQSQTRLNDFHFAHPRNVDIEKTYL